MAESLICNNTQSRVSSVLNRDVKQFGKKFMFDSNEETCWNSDQGESQWVVLEFPQPVKVFELRIQFQGGFSGKSCKLEGSAKKEDHKHIVDFYPEDNNCLQSFPIQDVPLVQKLKIVFENSADFFGRIIVYTLEILGEKVL
ncbi:nuclear receptor 2C2-associated protein-like [Sinocyclocheilus rhinocerous]|uniref:Nuclear receptor 2C2-associated protein n=1 Tax=Sinocyclocheilus rhinocerous TaxID=307959 RepID=A0A673JJG2_9TELE|nr:PREDICTED: nuclear receptor 2C2-associated protein-like [Sinocyclocheilus rhinocerous]